MTRALSNTQIARAALVVVFGFLASGVLGLVRTAAFSITFGASDSLDAFYAAQRIPETLFVLVAGGALGSSFIPVFERFLSKDDTDGAWRLASAVMSCVAVIAVIIAALIAVAAPILVPPILEPGADAAQQALTTSLTQIMLLTVVIFSISGLLMGILNAQGLFTLPALALSMNNIGQIFGAFVLTRLFPPENAVYGLAWGAVLGAALHLIIQLPGLRGAGARLRVLVDPRVAGVREVLVLMLPRILGLAVVQINFIVNVNLTSGMAEGSRTALITAWQLMFFALGVIAQSVGTALFPSLSALAASNDMDGYKDRLASALRNVLFLSFPASVGLMLLGQPVIALAFQYGEWGETSTAATAWALAFFAVGIAGHSLLEVLSRAFYALGDTRTPVTIGVGAMIANIALSLLLIQFIGDPDDLRMGAFGGLALANSLTTLAEGVILWALLRRRIGGVNDRHVIDGALRSLLAAGIMGAGIMALLPLVPPLVLIPGGVVVFFGAALILRIDEVFSVPRAFLRRR